MGRWGDGIYQSDATLDYHSTITNRLEREIAFWVTPERIKYDVCYVLAQILAVVEIMLLFEYHQIGSSAYLEGQETAVQRWREVFLSVWDGDWEDEYRTAYPYHAPEYRQQQRPAVIAIFDCLESIVHYWMMVEKNTRTEVTPMPPEYPLPYFSLIRWQTKDDREVFTVARFTGDLIEELVKDIIYWLSPEKRSEDSNYYLEEQVWAAVDILGFLCVVYERSPGMNEQVIRTWRDTTNQIGKEVSGDDKWNESNPLYQNAVRAFDRLESVAQKYPPKW